MSSLLRNTFGSAPVEYGLCNGAWIATALADLGLDSAHVFIGVKYRIKAGSGTFPYSITAWWGVI